MGSNLQYKGLEEALRSINKTGGGSKADEPTVDEVNKDWRRLAVFMSGKT